MLSLILDGSYELKVPEKLYSCKIRISLSLSFFYFQLHSLHTWIHWNSYL